MLSHHYVSLNTSNFRSQYFPRTWDLPVITNVTAHFILYSAWQQMLSMIWKAGLYCCKHHIYVNIWSIFCIKKKCTYDSCRAHINHRLLKMIFIMIKFSYNTVKVTYTWNEVQTHTIFTSCNGVKFTDLQISLVCQ